MKSISRSPFILFLLYGLVFAVGDVCAHSQALPVASQDQSAQSGTQGARTSGVSVKDEEFPKEWPIAPNILYYENFLSWVGGEDTRVQQETQAGKQQIAPRVDYASAIGISKDKEQAMLAILLDAYRKSEENRTQYKQADDQLLADPSAATDLAQHAHLYRAMLKSNRVILDDAYTKLKETLGQEDFQKLDRYLDREFAGPAYPASLRAEQGATTVNSTITPFPADVRYEFFIRHVGSEDARVQRDIQAGHANVPRQDYSRVVHIPEAEEQPLLTIVLEGCEQLKENDRQTSEAIRKIHEKYGIVLPPPSQMPPDLQALAAKLEAQRKGIIEETMARLKQELGPEYFDDLDAWISHHWAGGAVYTLPNPASNPAPQKTPGIQRPPSASWSQN